MSEPAVLEVEDDFPGYLEFQQDRIAHQIHKDFQERSVLEPRPVECGKVIPIDRTAWARALIWRAAPHIERLYRCGPGEESMLGLLQDMQAFLDGET